MKLLTCLKFIAPIGLCATAACSGEAPAAPDSSTTQEVAACLQQGGKEVQRAPAMLDLVGDAFSTVSPTAAQQIIMAQVADQIRASLAMVADARRAIMASLAAQLEAGVAIVPTPIAPQINAFVSAREQAAPVMGKGLEQLHGVLSEEQRGIFVDTIQARMSAIAAASAAAFEAFQREFAFTTEQIVRVQALIAQANAEFQQAFARTAALFTAFRAPIFSAEAVVPTAVVGKEARQTAEGIVGRAAELGTVLTPQQRTELGQKMQAPLGEKGAAAPQMCTPTASKSVGKSEQGLIVAGGYPGFYGGGLYGSSLYGAGYASGYSSSYASGYSSAYPFGLYGYGYGLGYPYLASPYSGYAFTTGFPFASSFGTVLW